ncbi:chorismate mutase [Clostridium acidisoli DSM 12555]|uniref:Bifunctional chorismate mutase/prephenate dehydratase n=1 Tax=Clostridium acidisoli DSM 12555 TaxID=1121291 RepID=A0A1W1XUP1_9CLOT|nr:prephenate dehydratase [Clostridium acidisoli]SMC27554.1 chorismate mutase [Clostridium acidisoli DSM 12555]
MKDLETLRKEIDTIDAQLIALYEQRMDAVMGVAEFKSKHSIPILNDSREAEVIKKNLKLLQNMEYVKPTEELLKSIMTISRNFQSKKIFSNTEDDSVTSCDKFQYTTKDDEATGNYTIGFQGVPGSFSEEALISYFGETVQSKNFNEFEDVFEALKNEEIHYGVLPVENSSTGGINEVYDLLRKYGLYIVGETCIKVSHNLLGVSGTKIDDIKEVYSHPQAFEQSSTFFKEHPNLKLIPYYNTAISAKLVSEKNIRTISAVASEKAAKLYNLEIIAKDINYNTHNYTRFIIVSKNLEINKQCDKISVVITVPHKTGSLYNILSNFAENNLNMMKIESRPIEGKPWEYFFYIDFEGNIANTKIQSALSLIDGNSSYFKLLGNYKCTTL